MGELLQTMLYKLRVNKCYIIPSHKPQTMELLEGIVSSVSNASPKNT